MLYAELRNRNWGNEATPHDKDVPQDGEKCNYAETILK